MSSGFWTVLIESLLWAASENKEGEFYLTPPTKIKVEFSIIGSAPLLWMYCKQKKQKEALTSLMIFNKPRVSVPNLRCF